MIRARDEPICRVEEGRMGAGEVGG